MKKMQNLLVTIIYAIPVMLSATLCVLKHPALLWSSYMMFGIGVLTTSWGLTKILSNPRDSSSAEIQTGMGLFLMGVAVICLLIAQGKIFGPGI